MLESLVLALQVEQNASRLPPFDAGFRLHQNGKGQVCRPWVRLQLELDRRHAIDQSARAELSNHWRRLRGFSQDALLELPANVDGRGFPFLRVVGRMGCKSLQQCSALPGRIGGRV